MYSFSKTLLTSYFFNAYFILSPFFCFSQIKAPQTPEPIKWSPVQTGSTYVNPNSRKSYQQSSGSPGASANDIIRQQNDAALKQMGHHTPVLPPSDPALIGDFIINQYKHEENSETQFAYKVIEELNEIRRKESVKRDDYFDTDKFKAETKNYWKAKSLLNDMLTGKIPLSLKDAFYILESAYGETHLSYDEYSSTLIKSADFIKQWMNENGLNTSNNTALHLGIQTFMRDTLTITKLARERTQKVKTTHLPFYYDYVDFRAEEDFRNYFVTKTLATGSGQCNSLPMTYLLLAEELGVKAYLSYAPLHSFIKFPDDKGNIHNYEVTSHYEISDQWYAQHLAITAAAKRSKIYLDTLNKKQIVAGAMMDLAFGYLRKHGPAGGKFIDECVKDAIHYFPNGNANVQGWLLRSTLTVARLQRILDYEGIHDLNDIHKSPEATQAYNQWQAIEQKLSALGYQELPTSMYTQLMQQQDSKGEQQKKMIDTKTKRSLFHTFK